MFDELALLQAAKVMRVAPDAVRLARRVQVASPELHERVKSGELNLREATRMAGIVPTRAERRVLASM